MTKICVQSVAGVSMAFGLLMAGSGPSQAQTEGPATELVQAAPQRTYNLAPQPLESAVPLFSRQSGRQVTADAALVRGLSTQGVQGTMTLEDALQRLLAGTGLVYSIASGTTIALQRAGQSGALVPGVMQLEPVQVQGNQIPSQALIDNVPPPYAGGQVATGGQLGLLGNRGVMDTPFNQTSYTAKKAQDQQAKTVQDVLTDDPSVRVIRSDGSAGADSVRIRGFTVNALSTAYGGLYGMLPTVSIMAELAERVEVLKGPSAMLNGFQPGGAIGGMINVVPKRAPDDPLAQVTASYASAAQFGVHADVAQRFGPDKEFGVRFNGVFKGGQTDVQWNTDQRALGILGLDFRGDRVRLSGDFGYQAQTIGGVIGYVGLANGVPLPWAPSARSNPAGQPWNEQSRKDLFGVVRAEIDLAEDVTAYVSFGAHDYRLAGLYTSYTTITNFYGTATAAAATNLGEYGTYRTAEAGVRALVDTGPIAHALALTATTYGAENGSAFVSGTAFATNIYNPTVVTRPSIATPAVNKVSTSTLSSFGIADTLSAAGKRIQLTAGVRLQQVQGANFNATSGAQTSQYDASALSPSLSLVLKPWRNVSVYGNWIQGLQQGTTVGQQYTNAGEVFPPYKSTQYEAGVKVDWGKFTTTASLFQITQPSILTNVATNTQYLGGQQRNQGLEFNVFGEPAEGVRLLGGFMLLNAVLASTQGGLTDGWTAPFSPGFNLNVGAEWDLPFVRGLTLDGRVVYTSSQYIDTTSPRRSLPAWTRFDVGARYTFDNPAAKGKPLVARFNVENLLDANYWAGGNSATFLMLGAPRTFRFALSADF